MEQKVCCGVSKERISVTLPAVILGREILSLSTSLYDLNDPSTMIKKLVAVFFEMTTNANREECQSQCQGFVSKHYTDDWFLVIKLEELQNTFFISEFVVKYGRIFN